MRINYTDGRLTVDLEWDFAAWMCVAAVALAITIGITTYNVEALWYPPVPKVHQTMTVNP